MIALNELSELQEIDLRLDAVRRERDARVTLTGEDPLLVGLRAQESAQGESLDEVGRQRKLLEQSTEAARIKIDTEDAKLYGGEVKDPKELSNLQAEIFSLRRAFKADEDQLLAVIEQEEEAKAGATHLTKLIEASSVAWEEQQKELKQEIAVLDEQIAGMASEVDATRAEIEAEGLHVYDTQRRLMAIAISRVIGGVCNGCRLTLPIYAVNRARRAEEPVRCPSCQRILYVA